MTTQVAYVAVSNPDHRSRIVDDLRARGWTVIEQPTGAHLLAALAEVIDGTSAAPPAKIVIDAHARGCTGRSIAAGLAALGLAIPVELVEEGAAEARHAARPEDISEKIADRYRAYQHGAA